MADNVKVDLRSERCPWCQGHDLYLKYHDEEWGVPVYDDQKIFEFLVLESAQAGLSWLTILKRREGYRQAFAGFNPVVVAEFGPEKIEELMNDVRIIRNRRKIEATINNARCFLKVQSEFVTFSRYIWSFVNGQPVQNQYSALHEIPAKTELSEQLSKDLKKRGFGFLGPTVIYAHMQATGMVNDHLVSCFRHRELFTQS